MTDERNHRPSEVTGPLGEKLTIPDLPPRDTSRWIVRRQAEVVSAVNGGLLSVHDVMDRCGINLEEFASWQRAVPLWHTRAPCHSHPALPRAISPKPQVPVEMRPGTNRLGKHWQQFGQLLALGHPLLVESPAANWRD